ncbi:MAG: hypothetical protein K0B09_01860 [Bacteroidales bacterium]|nr:hypothetical protein [Bacteroidales bacterium]
MKNENRAASLLSALLHPLILPTLGLIILFNLNTYLSYSIPGQAKKFILLIVFINSAIAPVLSILLLKKTGFIKDITLDDRSERMLPLLLSAIYFFLTYFLLRKVALPSLLYFYIIGATMLVLLSLIITYRWKISIHMVSMGGFTGFLISIALLLQIDVYWLLMLTFLLSGMLGTARVIVNAHDLPQVFAGYAMGVGVMLVLFLYLKA